MIYYLKINKKEIKKKQINFKRNIIIKRNLLLLNDFHNI
jgi:hypothetical protein